MLFRNEPDRQLNEGFLPFEMDSAQTDILAEYKKRCLRRRLAAISPRFLSFYLLKLFSVIRFESSKAFERDTHSPLAQLSIMHIRLRLSVCAAKKTSKKDFERPDIIPVRHAVKSGCQRIPKY